MRANLASLHTLQHTRELSEIFESFAPAKEKFYSRVESQIANRLAVFTTPVNTG